MIKTDIFLFVESNSVEPVDSYDYLVPLDISSKLISLQVKMRNRRADVPIKLYRRDSGLFSVFRICFKSNPIESGYNAEFQVEEMFYQINQVLPKSAGLDQKQFLMVELTSNYASVYKSEDYSFSVALPNYSSILK